jgi:Superfamily I DNA and RNA helicases and helicase subunits
VAAITEEEDYEEGEEDYAEDDGILKPVFDHPPDLIARHDAFITSTLKTVRKLAALDRVSNLIVHQITAQHGDILEQRTGNDRIREKNTLRFRLPQSRMLNLAIDLGIRDAFFVPGDTPPDLSAGLPQKPESGWVKLGTTLLPTEDDGYYQIAIEDRQVGLSGTRGTLIIEPNNGHQAFIAFLLLLKRNPNSFGIHVAQRLLAFREGDVVMPQERMFPPLSQEQSYACSFHLTNTLTFLWGPPGTGKSSVLTKMTSLNLAAGRTVAVAAASNDAIDAVAEKLCKLHKNEQDKYVSNAINALSVIRFGRSPRIAHYRPISEQVVKAKSGSMALYNPRVGLATFHRLFISEPTLYDTVCIDEAGMVPPPVAYAISCLAKSKVVLCGDPKQAQPIFTGKARDFGGKVLRYWKSNVFDFAGLRLNPGDAPDPRVVILSTQYRFVPEILDYVNTTGLYRDYRCPDPPRPLDPQEQVALGATPLPGRSVVILDTSRLAVDRPSKHFNRAHMAVVCDLVMQWIRSGMGARIGITSPYVEQASAYRRWVKDHSLQQVTASTIHGFQGSEFPVLIYDSVEGPGADRFYHEGKGMHFLTDETRNKEAIYLHNVGITRAQAKLIFVINCDYIRKTFSPRAFIRRLLQMGAERGSIICAASGAPHAPIVSTTFSLTPQSVPETSFYDQLKADASRARQRIDVASTLLDEAYVKSCAKALLKARMSKDVTITFYGPSLRTGSHHDFPEVNLRALTRFECEGFVSFDNALIYLPREPEDVTAPLAGYLPPLTQRVLLTA